MLLPCLHRTNGCLQNMVLKVNLSATDLGCVLPTGGLLEAGCIIFQSS